MHRPSFDLLCLMYLFIVLESRKYSRKIRLVEVLPCHVTYHSIWIIIAHPLLTLILVIQKVLNLIHISIFQFYCIYGIILCTSLCPRCNSKPQGFHGLPFFSPSWIYEWMNSIPISYCCLWYSRSSVEQKKSSKYLHWAAGHLTLHILLLLQEKGWFASQLPLSV